MVSCGALIISPNGKKEDQGFQLGCPGVERIVGYIRQGRVEVIRKIKAKRYNEEYLTILENMSLKKSKFPCSYHLKDLLGGDYVEQYVFICICFKMKIYIKIYRSDTPTGKVIRFLAK